MNPVETHEITELIGKLREELGYTIFVIEHDMHVVEGISDRVVALDHGIKIAEGSFDEVATDPSVVEAYLGLRRAETAIVSDGPAKPLLEFEHVDTYYGQIHILERRLAAGRRGRARLPARRQRVGQVDDAEDGPRDRPAPRRAASSLRRRGPDRAQHELPDRPGDGDRARRTAGCSRR